MTSVKHNVNVEESMTFLIGSIIDRLEQYSGKANIIFKEQKTRETVKLRSKTTISRIRENKKNKYC